MMVAKSGRTTGLTCAAISAVNVDVVVDYFTDCAETEHAFTKTFTNQIAIAGTSFSDAGDSGALVVDSANAEPVGLFFAGATDTNVVEHAIASPVSDVLTTLDSQISGINGQTSYSFVGGSDHPVSCLSYDSAKTAEDPAGSADGAALTAVERQRAEAALPQAQLLLNPANGIVRVGIAASKDRVGEGAIAFFVEPGAIASAGTVIPAFIGGVPTVVRTASGIAPDAATGSAAVHPTVASLNQALALKQRVASSLLKTTPAIFGVGVGQSLDNPGDAALMLFVDRKSFSGSLPESLEATGGVRVSTILMDRLHVTRSHGFPVKSATSCVSSRRAAGDSEDGFSPSVEASDPPLNRLQDRIQLPD